MSTSGTPCCTAEPPKDESEGHAVMTETLELALLYTPAEIAQQLKIGKSKTYALIASGEIRSIRVGALRRVRRDDLLSYVARLAENSAV